MLGATMQNLWLLLTMDFLKWVALAVLLSVPLNWWVLKNWLDNFANRINDKYTTRGFGGTVSGHDHPVQGRNGGIDIGHHWKGDFDIKFLLNVALFKK